jgi:hypothetical protein
MKTVAVLFARAGSVYKTIPGVDVYDIDRDARTFPGGMPVVAHPPCRSWGGFSMFAKPRDDEKLLAPWAIEQVRENGGVLEHPGASKLWPAMNLPEPGAGMDKHGGWTLPIHQHWFGHRAEKKTRLYIVGVTPWEIPSIPMVLGHATHVIGDVGRASNGTKRPEVTKSEREHTPPDLAVWLVELARRTNVCGVSV